MPVRTKYLAQMLEWDGPKNKGIRMKIISVVGARPNFMKIAPFCRAITAHNERLQAELGEEAASSPLYIEHLLVHTGQHYDDRMSKNFFESLNIPNADINLNVHGGTNDEQIEATMEAFKPIVEAEKPDWIVVVGDVNATAACSQVGKAAGCKVAHIEAGLRSYDNDMPEERNRIITDGLSDLLLTPDRISQQILLDEGKNPTSIKFVGNIMIDTLEEQREKASALDPVAIVESALLEKEEIPAQALADLRTGNYGFITMHRPSNVDHAEILTPIINFFCDELKDKLTLIWPVHPRTKKNMIAFDLWDKVLAQPHILITQPLGYHDLLRLNMGAKLALTDSGGLQEECCVLGTPCLTLRWNTERPITLEEHGGASTLVGNDVGNIRSALTRVLSEERKPMRPELWDGKTAQRCVREIVQAHEESLA